MSARRRLVLYCSNGKYGWCTDSCLLLGRCPLLGMSIIRGSTVLHNTVYTVIHFNDTKVQFPVVFLEVRQVPDLLDWALRPCFHVFIRVTA